MMAPTRSRSRGHGLPDESPSEAGKGDPPDRWLSLVKAVKHRSPRRLRDAVDASTRAYGMVTAAWRPYPDFLIIGTKRGGTTSLWNYLVRHPQVVPMFPSARDLKSPSYFFKNFDKGDRWYRSHFHTVAYRRWLRQRLGPTVTGESSPYYMYGPHAPRLLAQTIPAVRLIVLLRDPVDRAYGHYQERVKEGTEPLSFEDALAAEPARLAGEMDRMLREPQYYSVAHDFFSYRDRGIYPPQIERVFASFPAEQVLILRSEDLFVKTQRVFDQTCRFLGIAPMALEQPQQHNYIPRSPMDSRVRAELTEFFAPHNEALYARLGREFGWATTP